MREHGVRQRNSSLILLRLCPLPNDNMEYRSKRAWRRMLSMWFAILRVLHKITSGIHLAVVYGKVLMRVLEESLLCMKCLEGRGDRTQECTTRQRRVPRKEVCVYIFLRSEPYPCLSSWESIMKEVLGRHSLAILLTSSPSMFHLSNCYSSSQKRCSSFSKLFYRTVFSSIDGSSVRQWARCKPWFGF